MKRWIKASKAEFTNAELVQMLKDHDIDTTKAKYELKAQRYERYEEGAIYIKKFTCSGDWLAYFSMQFHRQPNAEEIDDYYGREEFEEMVEDYPTIDAILTTASKNWWGDGDDYIIYLKNLTSISNTTLGLALPI